MAIPARLANMTTLPFAARRYLGRAYALLTAPTMMEAEAKPEAKAEPKAEPPKAGPARKDDK